MLHSSIYSSSTKESLPADQLTSLDSVEECAVPASGVRKAGYLAKPEPCPQCAKATSLLKWGI